MPMTLVIIQYSASPLSKYRVNQPNMRGSIHSIILLVCACCGVAEGMVVIFCITHMEPPTRMGSKKGAGLLAENLARSIQRKELSRGTASLTLGSQLYRRPDRSASFSGVDGNVWRRAKKRPKKMGIWITIGPRQPRGLTPCSLYMRIVSWEARALSLGYFFWMSLTWGWIAAMAFICRLCFNVRGIISTRTMMVKNIMLSPKLLKNAQ